MERVRNSCALRNGFDLGCSSPANFFDVKINTANLSIAERVSQEFVAIWGCGCGVICYLFFGKSSSEELYVNNMN